MCKRILFATIGIEQWRNSWFLYKCKGCRIIVGDDVMDNLYVAAGRRIRIIREKSGYTREYVAMVADVSQKFLYEIEKGKKGFSADTLYRISKCLNVSNEYLLTGRHVSYIDDDIGEVFELLTDTQKEIVLQFLKTLYSTM